MYKFSFGLMSKVLNFDSEVVLRNFVSYDQILSVSYFHKELHMIKCAHEIGSGDQGFSALKKVGVIDRANSLQVLLFSSSTADTDSCI